MSAMTRRQWMEQAACAGCAAALGSVALTGCASIPWVPHQIEGQHLVLDASLLVEQRSVGLRNAALATPLIVSRVAEGQYVAVSALCTHKACLLRPGGERLLCPCHGSEFTLEGQVLSSPARKDLARFPVTERDGVLYVG